MYMFWSLKTKLREKSASGDVLRVFLVVARISQKYRFTSCVSVLLTKQNCKDWWRLTGIPERHIFKGDGLYLCIPRNYGAKIIHTCCTWMQYGKAVLLHK
ncbi:hypothetical protein BaRGS_00020262 [Batillaria attramentaria]